MQVHAIARPQVKDSTLAAHLVPRGVPVCTHHLYAVMAEAYPVTGEVQVIEKVM